jgi:hypothetical protein
MGLSHKVLEEIRDLKRHGFIGHNELVAEIGCQQLSDEFLSSTKELAEVYGLFGKPLVPLGTPVGRQNFTDCAPLSRTFWCSLGFQYVAIDLVGNDIVKLDLNQASVPSNLRNACGLVVNAGTTEHIANQENAFRFIHDLVARNGIMMHEVPCQGMITHGLVNYTMKFFWHLCRENEYEVIAMRLWVGPEMPMERNAVEFGIEFEEPQTLTPPMMRNMFIRCALRKPHERQFVTPCG